MPMTPELRDTQLWAPIVRSFVGIQRPLSVTDFEGALNGQQKAMGLEPTSVRARIYERLKDEPQAVHFDAAWEEAEALRSVAPWLSGLLGVLAAGHYAEATGIIGMAAPQLSCERLLDMLNSFTDAVYLSPFDLLIKRGHDSVVTPWQLRAFIDVGTVEPVDPNGCKITGDKGLNDFTMLEVELLEKRRRSRAIWTLSEDDHLAFSAGRTLWEERRRSRNALGGFLKYAALFARDSTLPLNDRKVLWRDFMTRWALSHQPGSDASALNILHLSDLISNPQSTLARELVRVLRFGSCGKDEIGRLAKRALHGLESVQMNGPRLST